MILLAVLRLAFADGLQRLNAVKNVLAGVANGVAAVLFIAVADVAWEAAALIAAGSIVGAAVGASYGRRLPEVWLRRIVIVGGHDRRRHPDLRLTRRAHPCSTMHERA